MACSSNTFGVDWYNTPRIALLAQIQMYVATIPVVGFVLGASQKESVARSRARRARIFSPVKFSHAHVWRRTINKLRTIQIVGVEIQTSQFLFAEKPVSQNSDPSCPQTLLDVSKDFTVKKKTPSTLGILLPSTMDSDVKNDDVYEAVR